MPTAAGEGHLGFGHSASTEVKRFAIPGFGTQKPPKARRTHTPTLGRIAEFADLMLAYRTMTRDAVVYVRGRVRHDDHATIRLRDWHRVYLNSDFTTGRVTFYD